jgi:hypothetical protein
MRPSVARNALFIAISIASQTAMLGGCSGNEGGHIDTPLFEAGAQDDALRPTANDYIEDIEILFAN